MGSRFTQLLLVAVLGAMSCATGLPAQTTTTGGLTGVVKDPSGPNAHVEIRDNSEGTTQSIKTDHAGVYRFFFLAPGRFTLIVSHTGFRNEMRTVILICVSKPSMKKRFDLDTTLDLSKRRALFSEPPPHRPDPADQAGAEHEE